MKNWRYWQHIITGEVVRSERHPSPDWKQVSQTQYYKVKKAAQHSVEPTGYTSNGLPNSNTHWVSHNKAM